jgi:hypothetical protein
MLNEMRGRPLAIYVGKCSLTLLAAFLRGYEHAVATFLAEGPDEFLTGFRDWVHKRFQTTVHSWEHTILLQSADEADAVRRFWELLDEYLKECQAVVAAPDTAANGAPGTTVKA